MNKTRNTKVDLYVATCEDSSMTVKHLMFVLLQHDLVADTGICLNQAQQSHTDHQSGWWQFVCLLWCRIVFSKNWYCLGWSLCSSISSLKQYSICCPINILLPGLNERNTFLHSKFLDEQLIQKDGAAFSFGGVGLRAVYTVRWLSTWRCSTPSYCKHTKQAECSSLLCVCPNFWQWKHCIRFRK
jgi:hypothetical protein